MPRTLVDSSLLAPFSTTFVGVGRNRMINTQGQIDQVNAGAAYSVSSGASLRNLDCWQASGETADGVFTITRMGGSGLSGFNNFWRAAVTTADASIGAAQRYYQAAAIEGYFVRDFLYGLAGAKTATLSFWVRSSLTGTFSIAFQNNTVNRSYPTTYTINSANTWEFKTITFPGDTGGSWNSTTGTGLFIIWDLGSGSSHRSTANSWQAGTFEGVTGSVSLISTNAATLDVTGTQLEIGSVATPFEYRPYPMELFFCQRYYEKSYSTETQIATNDSTGRTMVYGSSDASADILETVRFAVPKRAAPTITFYRSDAANSNWNYQRNGASGDTGMSAALIGTNQFLAVGDIGAAWVVGLMYGHWTADARL